MYEAGLRQVATPPQRAAMAQDIAVANRGFSKRDPIPESIDKENVVGGRWALGEKIGEGGMGSVFSATDLWTGNVVVVKLEAHYGYEGLGYEGSKRSFIREAIALSRLSGKNIVRLAGSGSHDGREYIAMEHVEGDTLESEIRPYTPLDRKIAKEALLQICDALQGVHEKDMAHGDVKPANIVLKVDDSGKVNATLLDFGNVRFLVPFEGVPTLVDEEMCSGSPTYMAPEQLDGPGDQRVDIYSLGIVMYQALTGINPFDSWVRPMPGVYEAVGRYTPPAPSTLTEGISQSTDSLVMRAMEKDPSKRFQTIGEMRAAIEAAF